MGKVNVSKHGCLRRRFPILLVSVGLLFCGIAAYSLAMYFQERWYLRERAESIVRGYESNRELVLASLTDWVYNNEGFRKNPNFFLVPEFGPTATQVIEYGGDCADKSRLLSAMLYELGIDSTLVMLYSKLDGRPTHTIVETREEDFKAVADPVFNIVFPDANGHLLGLIALRDNPDILENRLNDLGSERGRMDKINYYKRLTESYDYPKTMNWDRNLLAQWTKRLLEAWVDDPYLLERPRILDTPYLLAFTLAAGLALTFFALWIFMLRLTRKQRRAGEGVGSQDVITHA